jgi:hypothetical protein
VLVSAAEAAHRLTELLETGTVSTLEPELREILALLKADEDDLRTRLLDVAEYAVEQLAARGLAPVEIEAPANALAWTVNYGWIFQPHELRDAQDEGEIVYAVEGGKTDRVTGSAPLAAVLRVDRTHEQFRARVISALALRP